MFLWLVVALIVDGIDGPWRGASTFRRTGPPMTAS